MAPRAATAFCVGASSTAGSCTKCWVPKLCRPRGGPPYTNEVLNAIISAESTLASSAGDTPAGAAAAEEAGRGPRTPAARDSPGSYPGQAASAAAGTNAGTKSDSRAEAARLGSTPRESGAQAATDSADDAPGADSSAATAGLSCAGQPSASDANTGVAKADCSSPVTPSASTAVAERSTAHGAPAVSDVWDGNGGKAQTSSAQRSPDMPCSATAAGTAAAVDIVGLLPTRQAGQQPADTGSTQREASSLAHAGKQQTAHDGQNSDVVLQCSCSPPRSAAATGDPLECKKSREGAATVSGGSVEWSQAASSEPLTAQQHAVVATLMVVIKRAKLEGHKAFSIAREQLLYNNWQTQAVLLDIREGQELPSISYMAQMLQIGDQEDRYLLNALAMQFTAAGFQPLQVFTRSVQCGVMTASRAAESRGDAAVLARHQQVAELHRHLDKHRLNATWMRSNVDLLVRQGVDEIMAELIMLVLVLLAELCKRCSWTCGGMDYVALDHLLPGE